MIPKRVCGDHCQDLWQVGQSNVKTRVLCDEWASFLESRPALYFLFGELGTELSRGTEEGILGRAFGRVQDFGDRFQLHSLVVLQLENHALTRRKRAQSAQYVFPQDALP